MNSEAAFLFSTFKEFYKCWRSGTRARVFIESFNGQAFINFSAFLGHPGDAHFNPRPTKRNPSRGPRKKSEKKTKRDNDRAARFQQRKRKEEEAASASISKPVDNPEAIATSSPGAESEMTFSSQEFSFASPVPENLRQDKNENNSDSMIVSDKIERQEQEVIAPLPVIHGEEKVQDYKDSEEDICQRPSCKPDTCGTVCHDCEDIIYYVGKSSHTKRICHSKAPSCIHWSAPSWPGLAAKPAWRL